jgi:hypothetical protein
MMKMAVTVVALMVAALNLVMTVNLISHLTDQNAVIQLGMSLVLTVLILKLIITGIALVVAVQVMATLFVVMVPVMVMKLMKHAQMIVCLQANVQLVKLLTVTEQTNAGLKAGLVTASLIVMISSMVLT